MKKLLNEVKSDILNYILKKENINLFEVNSKTNKWRIDEMMSIISIDNKTKNSDSQMLRFAIVSEIDAINLYEQMAATTKNKEIKKILLDVANEEKVHIGEFQALLLKFDLFQEKALQNGSKEVIKLD
jgi:rubrerythrin